MSEKAKGAHPARAALEHFSARYPGIWPIVDEIRQTPVACQFSREVPYVFLTLGGARAALRTWAARNKHTGPLPTFSGDTESWVPACELKQFASWRPTQGIYRFDPTLYDALVNTSLEGEIPSELLHRLPEWSVYVETPGLMAPLAKGGFQPLIGFWATLEHIDGEGFDTIQLGFRTANGLGVNHFPLKGTLDESIRVIIEEWRDRHSDGTAQRTVPEGYADMAHQLFTPILSLLLYLCADESEIGAERERPVRPEPKRTKRGLRLFPAEHPRTWDVGVRMGAALRAAYRAQDSAESLATGRHVRPHVRRAHWHTFLAGRGREEKRVKWLPPIPVNLGDVSALPATIRPVKSFTE